jgi:hypothetical protein
VIFLSSPDNKRGPIKDREIYYIDGTDESYIDTQVRGKTAQKEVDDKIARVQTADDERATWVNLLSMLQREEEDSRKWDKKQRDETPPRHQVFKLPSYRLVVGLQKKTRSWDFMPGSITKVGAQLSWLFGHWTCADIVYLAIRYLGSMPFDRNGCNDGNVLESL